MYGMYGIYTTGYVYIMWWYKYDVKNKDDNIRLYVYLYTWYGRGIYWYDLCIRWEGSNVYI